MEQAYKSMLSKHVENKMYLSKHVSNKICLSSHVKNKTCLPRRLKKCDKLHINTSVGFPKLARNDHLKTTKL